uniref:Response regulatory domain-containing protein n=1 Tax=Fibrocapsa japonica TaxID=94617 RepID=A0A7S2UXA4_9STRA|mmetsp:Transcript_18393/g.26722  ORF Transcript_18393/g.26722 Transcript_18393/m.26722 type:complete len:258 (+) Transcript_18393:259-1032(+)
MKVQCHPLLGSRRVRVPVIWGPQVLRLGPLVVVVAAATQGQGQGQGQGLPPLLLRVGAPGSWTSQSLQTSRGLELLMGQWSVQGQGQGQVAVQVAVCGTGEECVSLASKLHPRLLAVLVNPSLPGGMDGLEAISQIRRMEAALFLRPTAVATLGTARATGAGGCHKAGADAVLSRPLRANDLRQVLEAATSAAEKRSAGACGDAHHPPSTKKRAGPGEDKRNAQSHFGSLEKFSFSPESTDPEGQPAPVEKRQRAIY